MVNTAKVKKSKASKAKKKAFNDMKENHEFVFLPFDRWLNRYVFI